jgi:hypothetical protein
MYAPWNLVAAPAASTSNWWQELTAWLDGIPQSAKIILAIGLLVLALIGAAKKLVTLVLITAVLSGAAFMWWFAQRPEASPF